ncbi:two-component system sensor histidine kinase NtrB [Aquibacillus kalidii]|uniref:two-component system sensor histidine kinase NtrB n=1 Tax=Aquibacillus kalidii TaxID=2762597 RepID=UPI00164744A1|nr:ATP-binding protein [Aquibacillus kalidii]
MRNKLLRFSPIPIFTSSVVTLAFSMFFLLQDFQYLAESLQESWLIMIFLLISVIVAQKYVIKLPPSDENAFSMDTPIYLAVMFYFGVESSLLLLVGNAIVYLFYRETVIWKQLINFSYYVFMIFGAYFTFLLTGGEVGSLILVDTHAYVVSMLCYYLINICLMMLYFRARRLSNNSAFFSRASAISRQIFKESTPNYLIAFLLVIILSIFIEAKSYLGIILFNICIMILSIIFKRYFEMYEEITIDRDNRQQIMDSLEVGVLVCGEDNNFLVINSAALTILNVDKEMVNAVALATKERPYINSNFWDILLSQKIIQNVKVKYDTGNEIKTLLVSQKELFNNVSKEVNRIFQFIDITEQDEIERRIHQSEKLASLGELSAGAAHEIRNPLTVIQGFLSIMNSSFSESENNKYRVPFLLEELERINSIVEEMLLLARPGDPNFEEVCLKDIIEEIMEHYSSTIEGIEFKVDLAPTKVYVDPKQIRQVLYNLIRNSSEAMDGKGTIFISSYLKNGVYRLLVRDTGPGITSTIQDTLFKPFRTSKDSGTGLGLSIVRRIIEDHNGKIGLYDTSDQGTTFLIEVPLKQPL